ncbi:HK97 family phage prohead protease [Kordiimonas marina]|uniref:HK97 family phage prohead protease n=1 Tax=Kordiimonas marina TaxID=2872312 RepID=UPI001FF30450|nr:HK97 family phage prohead protease [Kordiimonas marina]MCJ9428680.1 HK97 family phage prohead protease [Kordiimonas marina]
MSEMDTMDRHIIELPLEVKTGDTPGTFEGYGAIFGNVDRDGDVVAKGAFADSLKGNLPALLWQHNAKEPIGRFDVVREDDRGLYVKGRLAMTGRGLEAYALLKMGALDGLSIGFVTREAARDSVRGVRTITRADLMEISLVTFPANDLARISSVKGNRMQDDITDVRTFERFLRENGFSRSRAKAVATKGFRAGELETADSTEITGMVQRLKRSAMRLGTKDFTQVMRVIATVSPPFLPPNWGVWYQSDTLYSHPTDPTSLRLSFSGESQAEGPVEVEVKYVAPEGYVTKKFLSPVTEELLLAPNTWQKIQIRARSLSVNGQIILVQLLS